MNVEILRKAGIDYDGGVKRFVGRSNLYEKALSKFPKDGTFEKIRVAHKTGNYKELFSGVHEFKGMCGNIGLTSLYLAADVIVKVLRGNAFTEDELAADYEILESEYNRIYKAISFALEA